MLVRLTVLSLARIAPTCSELFRQPRTPVEKVLQERAASRSRVCPARLLHDFTSWPAHLAGLERRRYKEWAPVAAGFVGSFAVADGGRLLSCGADRYGVLGLDAHEGEDSVVVATSTPLLFIAGIRINSVFAGRKFNVAISAVGTVYTWGQRCGGLDHGNEEGSIVPKQVQTLAGRRCSQLPQEIFTAWLWLRRARCLLGALTVHTAMGETNLLLLL